eukprot:gene6187-7418_t
MASRRKARAKNVRKLINIVVLRKVSVSTSAASTVVRIRFGAQRCIHVYKPKKKTEEESDSFPFVLSGASRTAIEDYFAQFPPTEAELTTAASGSAEASKGQGKAGDQFFARGDGNENRVRYSHDGGKRLKGIRAMEMGETEIKGEVAALSKRLGSTPALRELTAKRAALPVADFKQQICDAVDSAESQVVCIAGETGCGKTTQVPQFLVERCWSQGRGCRVLCTQPRPISAMTVSKRVAAERGETLGAPAGVGYMVRNDKSGGLESSIMFCTNSVLLRRLTRYDLRDELADVSHIVIDEIHERDLYADFMLIVLKDLLPTFPHLKLVLMSATLNITAFSAYFDNCTVVHVPGFTYPVQDFFLEDALSLVGFATTAGSGQLPARSERIHAELEEMDPAELEAVGAAIMEAFMSEDGSAAQEVYGRPLSKLRDPMDAAFATLMSVVEYEGTWEYVNVPHGKTGATALMVAAGKGRVAEVATLLEHGADPLMQSHDGSSCRHWAERFHHEDAAALVEAREVAALQLEEEEEAKAALAEYQRSFDPNEVDLELVHKLLKYLYAHELEGAVLVFLPGWFEISRLQEKLLECSVMGCRTEHPALVLPLHSQVAAAEQQRVFDRPTAPTRKIILATNIGESAITIDDVVFVVDSGRLKEKSYDPHTGVATLQSAWVSQASARQRRGRAGRCQAGFCFRLFSRTRFKAMANYQLPEIKRSPLEELSLQVKLLEDARQEHAQATGGPVPVGLHDG